MPKIPKALQARLDRASHSFLEMAHGVGDAPKILFPEIKRQLASLHDELLVENPPKTAEQAEKAASILERHLEKWNSHENLTKEHSRLVALGRYKDADRIKRALDSFHKRVLAPPFPPFVIAHGQNKSQLVLSFSHPNKTPAHARQNAQWIAGLFGKFLEKYPDQAENIDEQIKLKAKGEFDSHDYPFFIDQSSEFLRALVAKQILHHLKIPSEHRVDYQGLAAQTWSNISGRRNYLQKDSASRVSRDPNHLQSLYLLRDGFNEVLSDLKAHAHLNSDVVRAHEALQYALSNNRFEAAIEIAAEHSQIKPVALRDDLIREAHESENLFAGESEAHYAVLEKFIKPKLKGIRKDLDMRGRRTDDAFLAVEYKLEPALQDLVLSNMLEDYRLTSSEQTAIKKALSEHWDEEHLAPMRRNENVDEALFDMSVKLPRIIASSVHSSDYRVIHLIRGSLWNLSERIRRAMGYLAPTLGKKTNF